MSQRPVRLLALFALVFASATALLACGGRAGDGLKLGDDGGIGTCEVLPCPSNAPWNPDTCACEATDDAGIPIVVDARAECPPIACPAGSELTLLKSSCVCISRPRDAGPDVTTFPEDAPYEYDSPYYYPDVGYSYDAPYFYPDGSCPFYNYNPCQPGYTLNAGCSCNLCPAVCPTGQTPGPGCNGCTACTSKCPVGFDYGPSCSCVPEGVEAGPPGPTDSGDAGVSCLVEGYTTCAPDSWCQLGTCPDGTSQYGCYCDHDGNSTCSLSCPIPPPCDIPGQASCPYGQQCIYGSCSTDPAASLLVCSCNSYGSSGSAYCYTASCADGGPQYLPDAGPPNSGGVTCLLEGYYTCNAGSFCPVGSCPDGSQYGCFCNQDGTATCNLNCPTPPPCQIPGEGSCPYGTSCVFGCGGGSAGTGLSCYCGWGGSANCSTQPCSQLSGVGSGPG